MERAIAERIVGAKVAGKYFIRRVVGAGSMGVVCEAEHLVIGKRLAIKLIDASLAGMSDVAMRFRQEARSAGLVESEHIVQVFDVGTDEELGLYLVMEYLAGEDLAAVLAREGRLPPDTAVRIAVQVARGLARAHEAGVVHRDLKPANIFLCERDDDAPFVKILDFGISKVMDASRADPKLKLTRSGTAVGTPQYMSPEQARGLPVDGRTDVWALGLVLYEMLAGRPAYPELPTYEQFIIHLVSTPPDPLSQVAPWVPRPLADAVHRALEHDVDARIADCHEMAKALLEAHPPQGGSAAVAPAVDESDTWADPQVASPYATGASGHEVDFDEAQPTLVTSGPASSVPLRRPGEASGVDAPPAAPAPAEPISASGIHDARGDLDPDCEEDAPQFFDRRTLERVGSPGAAHSALTAGVRTADVPVRTLGASGASSVLVWRRSPVLWGILACLAVALVIALALR